jgi:NTP pyrophosphatase (non-canonical NTP hydrolase)
MDEVYRKAIDTWGETAQLDQTIEELAELIQAINKYKRTKNIEPMLEEIADVEIMISQMKYLLTCNSTQTLFTAKESIEQIKDTKIKRIKDRLNNYNSLL